MKRFYTLAVFIIFVVTGNAQTYSSFKLFDSMPLDTFNDGRDLSGEFVDGILRFPSVYDTVWGYWKSGWAVSTMRDDSTDDATNLFSVITGARIDDSPYALGQNNSYFQTENSEKVLFEGMYISNTTFAYYSMKNGDGFAKKFGGDTGKDPDFFKLRIFGMKDNNVDSTNYIDFYLADFRFDEDSLDYIVDDWWYVDLSPLGYVEGLSFELSSSDVGDWGMNTPAFFAVDKIKYSYVALDHINSPWGSSFEVKDLSLDSFWNGSDLSGSFLDGPFEFECTYDTSWGGFWSGGFALSTMRDDVNGGAGNLYSSIPGGAYDGITYAVGQNHSVFQTSDGTYIESFRLTNTTYAYYSMKNGDAFAKKFGGESGDDSDFFKLRIYIIPTSVVTFRDDIDSSRYFDVYLADFRSSDNNEDYILDDWMEIEIPDSLGLAKGLAFELSSSDNGQWGMNTPAFFAIDRIEYVRESGINESGQFSGFNIYPNPASNYIKISSDIDMNKNIFRILDLSGKVLRKGNMKNDKIINIANLKTGTYIFSITDGKNAASRKFVKI